MIKPMDASLLYQSYEHHQLIPGPCGQLELVTATPKLPFKKRLIVCHADPLQKGSMHHKVVTTLCRQAYQLGLQSIRFNYRGVGQSSGSFAKTHGEAEDLVHVLTWAEQTYGVSPLWLAGFSFGATISAMVAGAMGDSVHGLISIAPALAKYDFNHLAQSIQCPWWMVQGLLDEVAPPNVAQAWCAKHPQVHLVTLAQADHFFHGQLPQLSAAVQHATHAYGLGS
jgi:uncharacterized protein